jgi:mycothiol synthase
VLAPFRKRGIGRALLERSLREFRRRGVEVAKLEVDAANETGATRLYERVGMRVEREYLLYEKPVGESAEPPAAKVD